MSDTPTQVTPSFAELMHAMSVLSATNDYIILRRFDKLPKAPQPLPPNARLGVVVDTETTGKGAEDAIIELGLVTFAFDALTGAFLGVVDSYCGLEDPKQPIPPDASAVNGITDEMVKDQVLDVERVLALVKDASLVIAHNSSFDRPKLEARIPYFAELPWVCSMTEVPWRGAGIETVKLKYIAHELGFFFQAHRADADCEATLQVLNVPLVELEDSKTGLACLLQARDTATQRIWAVNSPFASKDLLKARGYRWSDGAQPGSYKAWFIDVTTPETYAEELSWLKQSVYGTRVSVAVSRFDAYTRFSNRLGTAERVYLD